MTEAAAEPTKRRRGRPPRSPEERAAQRERLTAAVFDSLRQHGPDASLDDLAAGAGVSKPVLYDEFGDKNGIADAIAVALADEVEARVIDELATTGIVDIRAGVGWIIEGLVEIIDREPAAYAFIVRAIRTSDRGFLDNALVRAIHERARLLIQLVAANVPEDRVNVLLDGLFGFVFATVESWQTTRHVDRAQLVDDVIDVVTAGIRSVVDRYPPPEAT